jgi:hypothetical protein
MPDLTTVSAVKQWLSIAPTQTGSDANLATLVTATSADFLRAIDRVDLLENSYSEVREGDGGSRLALRHWPVTAITSLTVAGTAIAQSTAATVPGWYIEPNLDPERTNQLYLNNLVFTDLAQVIVNYLAGYEACPADIAQAVVEWVADRYRGRPADGVSSQRDAGGEHVAYSKELSMPATTAAVVERYRRTWPSLDKRNEDRNYRITRINRTYTQTISEKAQ